jgi:hypothetical protein
MNDQDQARLDFVIAGILLLLALLVAMAMADCLGWMPLEGLSAQN